MGALGFGGFSAEGYKPIIASLAKLARTEAQNRSPVEAQELSFNALAGFVQTLQESANKIEAKNKEVFGQELKKRKH